MHTKTEWYGEHPLMFNMKVLKEAIGAVFVVIALVLSTKIVLKKDEPFFNVNEIIRQHLSIFEQSKTQYFVFFGLPMLFSVGLAMLYTAGESFYSNISVILGIILSMLLASLSILSGYNFSTVKDEKQRANGKLVVKMTINTIMFVSLLCVFLLLYGLVMIVLCGGDYSWVCSSVVEICKAIASTIAYYTFSVILLSILLVFKQMSKIIKFNLEVKRGEDI